MMLVPIEHLDPRLQTYYDELVKFGDEVMEHLPIEQLAPSMWAWRLCANKVVSDLNEAAMEASYDSIVSKLNTDES